jgi:hypothetical protein
MGDIYLICFNKKLSELVKNKSLNKSVSGPTYFHVWRPTGCNLFYFSSKALRDNSTLGWSLTSLNGELSPTGKAKFKTKSCYHFKARGLHSHFYLLTGQQIVNNKLLKFHTNLFKIRLICNVLETFSHITWKFLLKILLMVIFNSYSLQIIYFIQNNNSDLLILVGEM